MLFCGVLFEKHNNFGMKSFSQVVFSLILPPLISKLIAMKKFLAFIIFLVLSVTSFAQEKGTFFQKIKEIFVVHDTIYIYADSAAMARDTIANLDAMEDLEDEEEVEGEEEYDHDGFSGGIPMPIDTIDTDDKFRKVVLFDDNTWLFYNIDKPVIPDSMDMTHWNPDIIHVTDVSLNDLPEEIEIRLIDSIHGYCIPHPGPVHSTFKYRKRRPHKGVDISLTTGDAI